MFRVCRVRTRIALVWVPGWRRILCVSLVNFPLFVLLPALESRDCGEVVVNSVVISVGELINSFDAQFLLVVGKVSEDAGGMRGFGWGCAPQGLRSRPLFSSSRQVARTGHPSAPMSVYLGAVTSITGFSASDHSPGAYKRHDHSPSLALVGQRNDVFT